MGLAKKAGKTASEQRKNKLHGSAPRRRMSVHAGTLRRLGEKPKRK